MKCAVEGCPRALRSRGLCRVCDAALNGPFTPRPRRIPLECGCGPQVKCADHDEQDKRIVDGIRAVLRMGPLYAAEGRPSEAQRFYSTQPDYTPSKYL